MIINLPEPDGRLEMEIWEIDPTSSFAFLPQIFQGRTQPIMVTFADVPCPCCAARQRFWSSFWRVLPMSVLAVLMIGLMCAATTPGAYEYGKTTQPRTTQQVAPVMAPLPTFVFDGGLLSQSMTPARLTELEGTAQFVVLSPPVAPVAPTVEEEDICATDLCHILLAAKPFLAVASQAVEPYLPVFLRPYLIGDPQEDKNDAVEPPFDYFDWVISIDKASFEGTTPAFLPSGPTTEESASAFYEMTIGHAPKIKKHESAVESESALFDTVWLGTDSFFAIIQQVIDFGQSTSDSLFDIFWSVTTLPARPAEFWAFLFLIVVLVSLDIFWDVRFWFLDYPLRFVYLLKLLFSKLRTVSHLLLNAWLSRVPLVGAQIPSMAGGMKEALRRLSEIIWRGAAESDGGDGPPPREVEASDDGLAGARGNGDGLVGDIMEEVGLAWRRGLEFARTFFGNGDWD